MAEDPRMAELIHKYSNCFSICGDGRVRCELNGHVFPKAVKFEEVSKFVSGPKFKKLSAKQKSATGLKRLEPFLVPSHNVPGHLWCALTRQLLVADLATAKKHMAGRKFLNAQGRFQEDLQDMYEEPSMSEGEQEEEEEEVGEEGSSCPRKAEGKGPGKAAGKAPKAAAVEVGGKRKAGKEGKRTIEGDLKRDGPPRGRKAKASKGGNHAGKDAEEEEEEEEAEFWVPEWAEEAVASDISDDGMPDSQRPPAAGGSEDRKKPNKKGRDHSTVQTKKAKKVVRGGLLEPITVVHAPRGQPGGKGRAGTVKKNPNKHKAKRLRSEL